MMYHKKYLRRLSAIGLAAAMTFAGVVQSMPNAQADPITNLTLPSISVVGMDLKPAVDADGHAVTVPQLGFMLLADPGTWSLGLGDGTTFTYNWWYSTSATATTGTNATTVTGGSRAARNFVPMYAQLGSYYGVTVTAHNGTNTATATAITTAPLVGFNPAMKARPTTVAALTTDLQTTPYNANVWITSYGWPDNSPPGAVMATGWTNSTYPNILGSVTGGNGRGIHDRANGTGTYDDPLTFALVVNNPDANTPVPVVVPYGTQIYIPRFQKYFIAEDMCYECQGDFGGQATVNGTDGLGQLLGAGGDGGPGMVHFDIWIGGKDDIFPDVMACENQITQSSDHPDKIVVNPPKDLTVSDTKIWDQSTGLCNGEPLDSTSGGTVGQYRSVDPDVYYQGAAYATQSQWTSTAAFNWPLWNGTTIATTSVPRPARASVNNRPDNTLCITDPGNSAQAGTWLTLETCDSTRAEQNLSYAGSFLIFNNMCLDISDGKGSPDSGAIAWNDQGNSTGPYPVTLHKCNYGTSDQWQVNPDGSVTDMQTGWWTLGNLGPDASGVTHLWALPIENTDQAAYTASFWDDPQTRDDSDMANIDASFDGSLTAGDAVDLTLSGLNTPTFQIQLVNTKTDKVIVLADEVPVNLLDSGASAGTWSGTVVIPPDVKKGTYQIQAVASTAVVPKMEFDPFDTTAVVSINDLQQTKDDLNEIGWQLSNFPDPPKNLTIGIVASTADLKIQAAAGSYTDTGGQPVGSMAPWIVLAGLVCVAGVMILVRRQTVFGTTRK